MSLYRSLRRTIFAVLAFFAACACLVCGLVESLQDNVWRAVFFCVVAVVVCLCNLFVKEPR